MLKPAMPMTMENPETGKFFRREPDSMGWDSDIVNSRLKVMRSNPDGADGAAQEVSCAASRAYSPNCVISRSTGSLACAQASKPPWIERTPR